MVSEFFWRRLSRQFNAGLAAIIIALVAASIVALALRARSPLEPVADQIMDRTPISIAIPLLLRLGSFARPLALLGAVALSMGVGGVLAVIYPFAAGARQYLDEREDRLPVNPLVAARATLTLIGLLAYVFVLFPSDNVIVELVEALGYLGFLHIFARPVPYSAARRDFLIHNARILGGIGVLVGLLYAGPLLDQFRAKEAGRNFFPWRPPRPRRPGFALAGLTPEVTPQEQFYIMDEDLQQPDLDVQSWSLAIGGMVRAPQTLTFAGLLSLPRRDELVTQECVSNPVGGSLISTALFSGVPLRALLAPAERMPGASAVLFTAADGHQEALPLRVVLDPSVMLVYAMNGRLLERSHGFPARLLVPGLYGYKGIKWVTAISLTSDPTSGHWESNGWNPFPQVQTMARIDIAVPVPGGVLVAGIAFAGRRGIRAVQVRVSGGRWHDAVLHTPALSSDTWVQWRTILPSRGALELQARAIDGMGNTQTSDQQSQKPSGATGYHTVHVTI